MAGRDLNHILEAKGYKRNDLNYVIHSNQLTKIAVRITDWVSCAAFLGVPQQDVDDVIDENRRVRNRRIAVLQRWKELKGRKATYLNLMESLAEMGRVDLIEFILSPEIRLPTSEAKEEEYLNVMDEGSREIRHTCFLVLISISRIVLSLHKTCKAKIITLVIFIILIASSFDVQLNHDSQHSNMNMITSTQSESVHMDVEQVKTKDQADIRNEIVNKTNKFNKCPVGHDLPYSKSPFVGRQHDISEIIKKLNQAHLVSISGAPGFGKSTLAIHVGRKMLERGTSVRYIDIADAFSHIKPQQNENIKVSTHRQDIKSKGTSIATHDDDISALTWHQFTTSSRHIADITADEILAWSKTVECPTVLILDNCDDRMDNDKGRQLFIGFMKKIVKYSQNNISILLTSRQQLLIVDDFNSWRVKELNLNSSIELLKELAPDINAEDATKIVSVVDGCPLALKVIGKILNRYDDKLVPRLEQELNMYPMNVLDKASTPNERFRVIMTMAFDRLQPSEQKFGYYISLFPGSFDYNAASAILPFNDSSKFLTNYTEKSLLEEYILGYGKLSRYKMHKLIKEYFREIGGTLPRIELFEAQFCRYFSQYIVKYAAQRKIFNVTEFEQYKFKVEHQNIQFLMDKLLRMVHLKHSTTEIQALAFAVTTEMIRKTDIQNKHVIMLRHVGAVCDILDEDKCGNLYSHIIQHLHKECGCHTKMDFVRQLIHDEYPCEEIFTCEILLEIDLIWLFLASSEKFFLVRITRFRCMVYFATIAALVNLNFLFPLLSVFLNLICPMTVFAPKSTFHFDFWLACVCNMLPLFALVYCLIFYLILDSMVAFLYTAFPLVLTLLFSFIASILNVLCWPLSNKVKIIFVFLYIVTFLMWIFSPVC